MCDSDFKGNQKRPCMIDRAAKRHKRHKNKISRLATSMDYNENMEIQTYYKFIMITGATFLSGQDGPFVSEITGSIVIRPETLF